MAIEKVPTAAEFHFETTQCRIMHRDVKTAMIEFAKLHVKAALEAAANNAEVSIELSNPYDPESEYAEVNKQSILSAYPESNIE